MDDHEGRLHGPMDLTEQHEEQIGAMPISPLSAAPADD